MRFISPHRGYTIGIRPPATVYDKYGQANVAERELTAEFDINMTAMPWEVDQATNSLVFKGMPVEEHTGDAIPAFSRVSIHDTEYAQQMNGWTDEERHAVEEKLQRMQNPEEFMLVEKPAVPVPWPAYPSVTSAAKIKKMVDELGLRPSDVIEYERDNAGRSDVIAALEELAVEQAENPSQEVVVRA